MKRNNPGTQDKWRQIVREQGQSGLSVREFCQKYGHPFYQFKYWEQKLGEQRAELQFVPAVVKGKALPNERTDEDGLLLKVGRARIRLRAGFDCALLREAILALEIDL